jgi:PAS domain S-box-containing protein
VLAQVVPERDIRGHIVGYLGTLTQITEQKRAQEALRVNEARFRAAFGFAPHGMSLTAPGGRFLQVNRFLCQMLGYTESELLQMRFQDISHPEDIEASVAGAKGLLENKLQSFEVEKRYLRKDGTVVWLLLRSNLIRDGDGEPLYFVSHMQDMTERKAAEEERDRLFREVEAARDRMQMLSHRLVEVQEQERRRIARELHDEIGQDLSALRLNLEQNAASFEARCNHPLSEAQSLVNKLLRVVRELSLDLRPTMLDDLGLLPALLWHFDRYFALSGIRVGFKHFGLEGRRFPAEIETAAYRIVQEALTNVLRHARAQEANVTVWVSDQNGTLSIQVDDSGAGFDVDLALKARNSSGLSGMSERAALLGGRLTIESVRAEGTCLTAELPIQPKQRAGISHD